MGVTQDYKAKLQEEENRKREIAKLSVEMQVQVLHVYTLAANVCVEFQN